MAGKTLIGVDIGTQGTKAAIFEVDGTCLAEAFQKSELYQPSPGIVEEDPEKQLDSVCNTIRACLQKSKIRAESVKGIAIDGQMAGVIGLGKDGRHVTPYDSWLDTRCAPYITVMNKEAGDEILAKTGGPPSFNHGPKILWWMHERREQFKTIKSFVQPGGYAALRLCGLNSTKAFIDKSYLHFSGFADNKKGLWDKDLCGHFKLEMDLLPDIVASQSLIGEVVPGMAQKCGLEPGVPVVAGCGDTAASFLSCGATSAGICVDVAGTAAVFATTEAAFRPDIEHQVLGCGQSATPGLWHPYAYINGGGMNLEWFRRKIASCRVKTEGKTLSFEELDRLVRDINPQGDDPLFIPHLGGRVCPSQPDLRGAWIGLRWNHTLGHLYRALLEGVALEYGIYLEILGQIYKDFQPLEIRITGGGGKSQVWNQIKADILGIPVVRIARTEGAPLGSALLAGFGVGLYNDLHRAAGKWIQAGKVTYPLKTGKPYSKERIRKYSAAMRAVNLLYNEEKPDIQ